MPSRSLPKLLLLLPFFLAAADAKCEKFSHIKEEEDSGFLGIFGGHPEVRWDYGIKLFTTENCAGSNDFYEKKMIDQMTTWLDDVECHEIKADPPIRSLVLYGKQDEDAEKHCTVSVYKEPDCMNSWDNTYNAKDRLAGNWDVVDEWLIRGNVTDVLRSWDVQCMDIGDTITSYDPFT